jgi:hypothetical protein
MRDRGVAPDIVTRAGDTDGERRVPGVMIRSLAVPTTRFSGSVPAFVPVVVARGRVLDRAAIRRQLPAAPPQVRWSLRVTTFDLHSPKELATTRLDTPGLRAAERALLTQSPGGSSNLGPALRSVEAAGFAGHRLLVVLSDLELYDPDVGQVFAELIDSTADEVLALVFRASPPPALIDTRVQVARVDPHTSVPADIARHIVEAACVMLRQRVQPHATVDVLIDVLDDESGSMWSGNDAFCLRHEAALIAVEHLAARQSPRPRNGKSSS